MLSSLSGECVLMLIGISSLEDDDVVDVEDNQRRAYCASRNVGVVRSTRNPPHIITTFCIFSYIMTELLKF